MNDLNNLVSFQVKLKNSNISLTKTLSQTAFLKLLVRGLDKPSYGLHGLYGWQLELRRLDGLMYGGVQYYFQRKTVL